MIKESVKLGRGFGFALALQPAAKAYYAGKGVAQGSKDRPIFWYSPTGSQRYRVIDATLEVKDMDNAPQVEGAVPLGNRGKT